MENKNILAQCEVFHFIIEIGLNRIYSTTTKPTQNLFIYPLHMPYIANIISDRNTEGTMFSLLAITIECMRSPKKKTNILWAI